MSQTEMCGKGVVRRCKTRPVVWDRLACVGAGSRPQLPDSARARWRLPVDVSKGGRTRRSGPDRARTASTARRGHAPRPERPQTPAVVPGAASVTRRIESPSTPLKNIDDHFEFFLALASWCAIPGWLHEIGKGLARANSAWESDLAGRIGENTHDEPP